MNSGAHGFSLQDCLVLMGVGEEGVVREGNVGDVGKFLNRILGLKVHQQNLVRLEMIRFCNSTLCKAYGFSVNMFHMP